MKTIDTLSKIFSDAKRSGIYYLAGKGDKVERAAKVAGLSIIKLDIGRSHGKSALLSLLARALKFPKYFGQNWDALHDHLTDLSWLNANGWLVIITNSRSFAESHGEDFEMAVEVLRTAAEHWRRQGKPFWILIQGEENWDAGLPKLPEN